MQLCIAPILAFFSVFPKWVVSMLWNDGRFINKDGVKSGTEKNAPLPTELSWKEFLKTAGLIYSKTYKFSQFREYVPGSSTLVPINDWYQSREIIRKWLNWNVSRKLFIWLPFRSNSRLITQIMHQLVRFVECSFVCLVVTQKCHCL